MTYDLVIGGVESVELASTRGWHDFKSWVDTLDEVQYRHLVHLVDWGWVQDLHELSGQLSVAMRFEPPADERVYITGYWLLGALENRALDAESVFVTDGLGEDDGEG